MAFLHYAGRLSSHYFHYMLIPITEGGNLLMDIEGGEVMERVRVG